jgi:hypothetical protein
VANPIDQPAPPTLGVGNVTDSEAPGALKEESTVLSSIGAAL